MDQAHWLRVVEISLKAQAIAQETATAPYDPNAPLLGS